MKILLGCMLFLPMVSLGQLREFNFYIEKKDSNVTLQLTSLETFPCLGYSIKTLEMWDHDTLVVEIRGFIKPRECFSTVDVARKIRPILGIRSNQFAVKLRWKEKSDLWFFDISSETLKVKELNRSFTSWFRD